MVSPSGRSGAALSQHNLGVMYDGGKGVPQNYAQAIKWYCLAAERGQCRRSVRPRPHVRHGKGVPQDYSEAAKWYRLAADQGQPDAQNNLGHFYRTGQGVPQDYVQAHMWLNLTASKYPASKKEERENAVAGRDSVGSKMTPAQIAEAQKLAREWKPKPER